jgi:hypothetical protein
LEKSTITPKSKLLLLHRLGGLSTKFGIRSAEELLRELQHAGLVFLGHAHDAHDDVQRVVQSHFPDEVAATAGGRHPRYGGLGDDPDLVFQPAQVLRHEPALGQRRYFM